MVQTPSTMIELGSRAPEFDLINTNQILGVERVTLDSHKGQPLLMVFLCNHCPYVVMMLEKLSELASKWQQKGVDVIAISSNDTAGYAADSPLNMTKLASKYQFSFAYLYDDTQEIAKAVRAACTPDFFLFNANHQLVYRGQFDDARSSNQIEPTGGDVDNAIMALLNGAEISKIQMPSVGCNIKWKSGNEPDYF